MKYELPHADDAIGIPEEYREKFQDALREYYERNDNGPIEGFELEKNERDKKILIEVNEAIDHYLEIYNRQKVMDPPASKIHLFEEGGVKEFTKGKVSEGAHAPKYGSVLIDRHASDVEFALNAFHELFHLKVYQILQITKPKDESEKTKLEDYRSGFVVTSRDGKEKYFQDINEAITEMMTERFFEDSVMHSDTFKNESPNESNIAFSRKRERANLNELIDELWSRNKIEFANREEIVNLFLDGEINGHILAIGKLIEKTFGKGSFRKVGKGEKLNFEGNLDASF